MIGMKKLFQGVNLDFSFSIYKSMTLEWVIFFTLSHTKMQEIKILNFYSQRSTPNGIVSGLNIRRRNGSCSHIIHQSIDKKLAFSMGSFLHQP